MGGERQALVRSPFSSGTSNPESPTTAPPRRPPTCPPPPLSSSTSPPPTRPLPPSPPQTSPPPSPAQDGSRASSSSSSPSSSSSSPCIDTRRPISRGQSGQSPSLESSPTRSNRPWKPTRRLGPLPSPP